MTEQTWEQYYKEAYSRTLASERKLLIQLESLEFFNAELQKDRDRHVLNAVELMRQRDELQRNLDFAGEILGNICVYGTLVYGEHPVDPPPHAAIDAILTQIERAEKSETEVMRLKSKYEAK